MFWLDVSAYGTNKYGEQVATTVRMVDGKLYGMSIGFSAYKGSGIGVANNVAVAVRIFIEFNAYLLEKTFPYWIMRFLPD